MEIKQVATSVAEVMSTDTAYPITVETTAAKLAPYCREGISLAYHNVLQPTIPDFIMPFPVHQTEGWVSFYMYTGDVTNTNYEHWMWALRDWANTSSKISFGLYKARNALTYTLQYPNGTSMVSVPITLTAALHRFDVYFKLNSTSGAFIVAIDGVEVVNVTGKIVDTTANFAGIDSVSFQAEGGSSTVHRVISGIWLSDEDTRGHHLCIDYPTADGSVNEFTGTYADVDEMGAGDTSYMFGATAGLSALLQFPALNSAVDAMTPVAVGLKLTGKGTWRGIDLMVKAGSTAVDASEIKPSAEFGRPMLYTGMTSVNPNTSAAWTVAEINAAQLGFKTT